MELQEIRNSLERKKGERDQVKKKIDLLDEEIITLSRSLRHHTQAQEVIREVGMKTQQQLSFHISDITSMALEAVFTDPYKLEVEFVPRRNKTECDLFFVRNGQRVDPLEASGIGAVDIASFALRIASWTMSAPRSRNTIILDEPFKCLSNDLQEQASAMLKEVSKKLNIQFIIITHEQILASYADKTFEVNMRKRGEWKVSRVVEY